MQQLPMFVPPRRDHSIGARMPEDGRDHVIAFSGGKDSTAMLLRLMEIEHRDYHVITTPTGNELPGLHEHVDRVEDMIGLPVKRLKNGTLESWMEQWNALPNSRMRWCTRVLKLVPCMDYVKSLSKPVLYVGLRADEEHRDGGLFGDGVDYRRPFADWGWGLRNVLDYLREIHVDVPQRTDCAWCFYQRLIEWKILWEDHPELYEEAVQWEAKTGHTFRSPFRDKWPADLEGLRAEFAKGRKIRGEERWRETADREDNPGCRVCRM